MLREHSPFRILVDAPKDCGFCFAANGRVRSVKPISAIGNTVLIPPGNDPPECRMANDFGYDSVESREVPAESHEQISDVVLKLAGRFD